MLGPSLRMQKKLEYPPLGDCNAFESILTIYFDLSKKFVIES